MNNEVVEKLYNWVLSMKHGDGDLYDIPFANITRPVTLKTGDIRKYCEIAVLWTDHIVEKIEGGSITGKTAEELEGFVTDPEADLVGKNIWYLVEKGIWDGVFHELSISISRIRGVPVGTFSYVLFVEKECIDILGILIQIYYRHDEAEESYLHCLAFMIRVELIKHTSGK